MVIDYICKHGKVLKEQNIIENEKKQKSGDKSNPILKTTRFKQKSFFGQ
jgi:hypothetical protein